MKSLKITKPPGYVTSTCLVSLAGVLNGYDTGSIGAVTEMPYFTNTIGQLTPVVRGLTVSMIMLTGVLPSFFAGHLADRYGRLAIIMAGTLIFVLGVILEGAAFHLPMLMLGRGLAGVGEGTWMSALAVYISEIAPASRRGTLVSLPQFGVTLGICLGYFTCYGSVHIQSSLSWRLPYIVQAILGIVLAASCLVIPHSPRWLLQRGQRDKAIRAIERLNFSTVEAEKDFLGPAAEQQRNVQPGPVEGLVMIFRKQYRSRTMLAFFMLGMIQLCGIDGVLYYAPTLFAQAGLPPTTASFLASGLSAILMLAISIPAMLYADRFARRTVILVGGFLLTGCMLLIGSLYASSSVSSTSPARWVVIVLVFVFSLTYCATWGVVGKIYASEIQPAATRSSANCVAQGLGFFTNGLVAILTPIFLANSSFGAYFLFGGFCLTTMLALWSYMPETRGQSLEAIEEIFKRPIGNSSKIVSVLKRCFGDRSPTGSSIRSMSNSMELEQREALEMNGGLIEGRSSHGSGAETGIMALRIEIM